MNAHAARRRRRARPSARRAQPPVDRRPAGHPAGDDGQPRRRRPLRHARPRRPRQRLHLHRRHVELDRLLRRRVALTERRRRRRPSRARSSRPTARSPRRRRPGPPCPTSRSRRGTARSGSTSCSSAATSDRASHPQHRHAHRRLDRPGHQAGRDVQPAARHGRRADPAGTGAAAPSARSTPGKINASGRRSATRTDLFPGKGNLTRGYNGLKAILGNLYGLDIKYFVEVNFDGFKKVVDTIGGVTINVQVPVADDRYPVDRQQPPAALHPDRHPAHGRRRGAPLRPLAARLERLRPRPAPAARPPLAARAGRPAEPHPAPARPRRGAQVDGQDRHPGRPARAAPRAGLGGRHEEHPLLRVRPAALPEGVHVEPARLHHRPEHQQDPGRGEEGVHDRPGRRGASARRSPRSRPASGSSTGRATRAAAPRSPATSTTTAWPRQRRARSRRAPCRPTRRSWSTTAPRRTCRTRSPTSRRRSGSR